jgi:hypothetical protein
MITATIKNFTESWITRSGTSTFNINWDCYDLEVKLSGIQQFDIHNAAEGLIEFDLDSSSSTFSVSHLCGVGGNLYNVPVPASNQRVWRLRKTSTYIAMYCEGREVGRFTRSTVWDSCSTAWSDLGRGLFFYDDDHATTHYRFVTSKFMTVDLALDLSFNDNRSKISLS